MISTTHKDDIFKRPLYKLSAYVYKYGKKPSANDVLGTGKDFELFEADFSRSGNVIRAESGAFPCGNAVSKTCKLTINSSTRYKAEDFAGAHLVLRTTAYLEEKTWVVTGDYYFVQTVTVESGKIVLECADLMTLADRPYKYDIKYHTAGVGYATFYDIFASVAKQMGLEAPVLGDVAPDADGDVDLANELMHESYNASTDLRLKNSNYTCRQMLGFIGMLTLSNIIVEAGSLSLRANSLLYYKSVNGQNEYLCKGHDLKDFWLNFTDEAEEIKITGVECTAKTDENGHNITPITYKSEIYSGKYVLDLSENPFFQDGYLLDWLYDYISIPKFKKYSATFMGYPLVEYGDYIHATHRGGDVESFITEYEWNISGSLAVGCNIESAADNSSTYTGGAGAAVTSNQAVLDSITSDKVDTWDAASVKAAAITDYIVEQGTSGPRWNYRKWASGIGECWGVFGDSMVNVNSAWGSVYYGGWMSSDANKAGRKYPFAFVSEPSVTAQYIGGNNDAWIVSDRGNNVNALTHAPAFSLVRPSAGTIYNPKLSYYVIGRYK